MHIRPYIPRKRVPLCSPIAHHRGGWVSRNSGWLEWAPVRVRAPLCSLDSAVSSLGRVLRLQPLTRFSLLFYLLAVHLTVLVHLMLSSRMLPPVPVPDEGDSATLKLD